MPSAVWIDRRGLAGLGYELGFAVMNDDQAARGELQLLNHFFVADARRVNVEGSAR